MTSGLADGKLDLIHRAQDMRHIVIHELVDKLGSNLILRSQVVHLCSSHIPFFNLLSSCKALKPSAVRSQLQLVTGEGFLSPFFIKSLNFSRKVFFLLNLHLLAMIRIDLHRGDLPCTVHDLQRGACFFMIIPWLQSKFYTNIFQVF